MAATAGLSIVLDRDLPQPRVDALILAIKQLRGVTDVTPVVDDIKSLVVETRAREYLRNKLWNALNQPDIDIPKAT